MVWAYIRNAFMWKYNENINFAFKIEFNLNSVNILGKLTRTCDLMVPEGPWKNMGLQRMPGIEFRGPKPEK